MLPKYHIKYTEEALKGLHLPVDEDRKTEIIIGSIANDCCEFTEEYYRSFCDKSFKRRWPLEAFYKSHFGELASMHAMSKESGKSADITRGEVASCFDFLNNVALKESIDPNETYLNVKVCDLVDSKCPSEIKYRAIGMMLHIIQDSYTPSHCERNVDDNVVKFYYYNYLSLKDVTEHHKGDNVIDMYKETLSNQCKNCVKSILIDKKKYDYTPILTLSPDAKPSDHDYNCNP